uniref:39S ribosomal protein L55, mitochondrial (inferred by orthology to a human protein) n=1 Tax=Anisakis simplex TaxID=6269 RepID=A0A0M3IY57_ANISI
LVKLGGCFFFNSVVSIYLFITPLFAVHYSAHRAAIAKIGRKEYIRRYPVTILRADGSTIKIRVAEPREFVQLPVDLEALTEDERRQRLAARKPKVKQIHEVRILF